MTTFSARALLTVGIIVGLVGCADAAIGRQWDLLVLLVTITVLQLAVVLKDANGRVAATLRPDLARWARDQSRRTGEPLDDVVDRALASYRDGLYRPESEAASRPS